ncbi:MAG: hypothetical protein ABJ327_10440 [Litoreibacter sp.]
MKYKDLLSLSDLDRQTLENLAERAVSFATEWVNRTMPQSIAGTRVGLIAELPGWRNPTALSLGVAVMGGTCVPVNAGLEGAEPPEDLAAYLDNWFDLIAVRTPNLAKLRCFANALQCPVMNLRTNDNHPFEVLGDLAFVLSQRGRWDGLTVAMVGPAANIARSWMEVAAVLPINVVQVTSSEFAFRSDLLPARMSVSTDPRAIEAADLIVTDCWSQGLTPEQKIDMERFRITVDVLDRARPDVLFVPCPPVTRGEEVSKDAMNHPRCFASQAKAYLMHAQNAFIEMALADKLRV